MHLNMASHDHTGRRKRRQITYWLSELFPGTDIFCFHSYLINWSKSHDHVACMPSHFSPVWLFMTPWTVALQAPLSMKFSRQEYWNGLLCPPLGDLSSPGMELVFTSPALAGRFFTTSTTWWGKEVLFYHIPRRSEVKWSRSVMSDSLQPYGL